jgi:hypothetical protein
VPPSVRLSRAPLIRIRERPRHSRAQVVYEIDDKRATMACGPERPAEDVYR